MNMSLGRLLATGRSLVGLRNGESRYRESKQVRLPKFISPKNPFASGDDNSELQVTVAPPVTVSATARSVAATPATPAKRGSSLLVRAGAWFGSLSTKVNPFRGRKERASAAPLPSAEAKPKQGELTLERVRVLRNDLSDADGAKAKTNVGAKPGIPVVAATLGKLEPVGAAWDRLATKFTGSDPT